MSQRAAALTSLSVLCVRVIVADRACGSHRCGLDVPHDFSFGQLPRSRARAVRAERRSWDFLQFPVSFTATPLSMLPSISPTPSETLYAISYQGLVKRWQSLACNRNKHSRLCLISSAKTSMLCPSQYESLGDGDNQHVLR